MNKITHLLLVGAAVFALCDVGASQETPPRPPAADSAAVDTIAERCPCAREPAGGLARQSRLRRWRGGLGGAATAARHPSFTVRTGKAPRRRGQSIDGPYFVPDPLLDPSFFPSPGWFAGAEVQIVKPHLIPN